MKTTPNNVMPRRVVLKVQRAGKGRFRISRASVRELRKKEGFIVKGKVKEEISRPTKFLPFQLLFRGRKFTINEGLDGRASIPKSIVKKPGNVRFTVVPVRRSTTVKRTFRTSDGINVQRQITRFVMRELRSLSRRDRSMIASQISDLASRNRSFPSVSIFFKFVIIRAADDQTADYWEVIPQEETFDRSGIRKQVIKTLERVETLYEDIALAGSPLATSIILEFYQVVFLK